MTEPQHNEHHPHLAPLPPWIRWLIAVAAAIVATVIALLAMAGITEGDGAGTATTRILLPVTGAGAAGGAGCWVALMSLVHRRGHGDQSVPALAYAVLVVPVTVLGAVGGAIVAWGVCSMMAGTGPSVAGDSAPIGRAVASLALAGSVGGAMAALMAHLGMLLIVSRKMMQMLKCRLDETDSAPVNQGETR